MQAIARNSSEKYALDRLTGRQKVAIVCTSIGAEAAAVITAGLNPEEAEIIALEMAQLGKVPTETVDAVLAEWLELTLGVDSLSTGGVEFAKDVLEKAFGAAKAGMILKRIQGQLADSDRFGRLRRADPQQLGNTLRGEHPQTIALILAHLDPGHVAAIIREIREEFGCEIVITRALPRFDYDYTRVVIEMIPFVCVLAENSPAPHPHEHVALAWARADELTDYDLAPADLPVVASYRASLTSSG